LESAAYAINSAAIKKGLASQPKDSAQLGKAKLITSIKAMDPGE
jgi:hypothetical protein